MPGNRCARLPNKTKSASGLYKTGLGRANNYQSGPMHEIALAVARSKRRRGLGKKPQPSDASGGASGSHAELRAVQVVGASKEWTAIGFTAGNGAPLHLQDLLNRCMQWAMEASRHIEPKMEPVNSPAATPETNDLGYTFPASGHYLVLKAGIRGTGDKWQNFPLSTKEFESLYAQCQTNGRRYLGHLNPIERRWPRDFSALTQEQTTIITKKVRVLVCGSDGDFFEVDFNVGEYQ